MNAKHQAFVNHYLADPTRNARQAYLKVYPKTKPAAADASASRLLKSDKVSKFLEEMQGKLTEDLVITTDFLTRELLENHKLARMDNKLNDSNRAIELIGKLHSKFIDKVETKDTTFEDFLKARYANKRD